MQLLETLGKRARESPEAPWLFYRHGLDWHWRSYRRIADQVARSAQALLQADSPSRSSPSEQNPDALAMLLANLATGLRIDFETKTDSASVAAPSRAIQAKAIQAKAIQSEAIADLSPWSPPTWLAPCRGTLERFEAQSLPATAAMPEGVEARRFMLRLVRDIEHLSALLGPRLRDLNARPILFAGSGVGSAAVHRLAALTGWTLESRATWALEPLADAFVATALWTRPHILVLTPAELAALEAHFGRSAKRHSRLKVILLLDGAAADGAALERAALERAALERAALDGAALDGAALDGAALDGAAPEEAERLGAPLLSWP